MAELILFGCGGHSRSIAAVALDRDPSLELLFVDDQAREGETVFGFRVVKELGLHMSPCIVAVGDNGVRREKYLSLRDADIVQVISQRAYLGRGSTIGRGVFVANDAHIGTMAHVGDNTIINTGAVLDHEVQLGDHCHIGPNSTVSGRTRIGNMVFLGVGATVVDRVSICSNVIVGAGSTVIHDIEEPGTYVGIPAVRKK